MTFKNDMHLVFFVVRKGWSSAVASAINDKIIGECKLFNGSNIPVEAKSGLLGISLKEESEMVIAVVEKNNLNCILEAGIQYGGINEADGGMCFSIPLDRMYVSDVAGEIPQTPASEPAELVHDENERIGPA